MSMERIKELLSLLLVFCFFIGSFFWIKRNLNPLDESLKRIEPIFLGINFSLMIVSLILSLKEIRKIFNSIQKKTWIFIFLIFLLGLTLRIFLTPHTHRLFFDESIYMDIGKEILTHQQACLCNYGNQRECYECELMKWPNAYPFTLAVAFLFFGVNEKVAFNLVVLLGSLSIILVALIAYLLSKKERIALYSALLFALIPIHIMWSGTVAPDPVFVFYTLLTILAFLFMKESDKLSVSVFAMSCLAFAVQMRAEGMILIPLVAILFIILSKNLKKKILDPKFFLSLLIFILIIPSSIHVYHASKTDTWGSSGKKFSLEYAKENVPVNAFFWVMGYKTIEHPILYTLFALLGILWLIKEKRIFLSLLAWFFTFFFLYASFYAGSVLYGVDVRYALSCYPPFIIAASYGMYGIEEEAKRRLKKNGLVGIFLVLIMLVSFFFYIPSISTPAEKIEEAKQARAYRKFVVNFAERMNESCYVLSHVPSIYLMHNKSSLQTWNGQNEERMRELFKKTDCVIFDDGFWCHVEPYESTVCKYMFDNYKLTKLASIEVDDKNYTLYKVSNPFK